MGERYCIYMRFLEARTYDWLYGRRIVVVFLFFVFLPFFHLSPSARVAKPMFCVTDRQQGCNSKVTNH